MQEEHICLFYFAAWNAMVVRNNLAIFYKINVAYDLIILL